MFVGEIIPTGFSVYGKDRGSRGGGVLIAVNDSVSSPLLPQSPTDLEVIAIKIGQNHNQLILCTVYIPSNPGDVYLNSLLSYLTHLVTTHEKIVITGNFNFPDINWSSLTGLCSSSNIFCDFIFNHNLTQLVENPTHNRVMYWTWS